MKSRQASNHLITVTVTIQFFQSPYELWPDSDRRPEHIISRSVRKKKKEAAAVKRHGYSWSNSCLNNPQESRLPHLTRGKEWEGGFFWFGRHPFFTFDKYHRFDRSPAAGTCRHKRCHWLVMSKVVLRTDDHGCPTHVFLSATFRTISVNRWFEPNQFLLAAWLQIDHFFPEKSLTIFMFPHRAEHSWNFLGISACL